MSQQPLLPTWPQERDLARYGELTDFDFESYFSPGKMWIDVGCRTGKALSEIMLQKKKIIPIGINAHPIEVRSGIHSLLATLPNYS